MPTQQEWDKIQKNKEKSIKQAMDRKDVGMSVGACMHAAIAIAVPKLLKEKASLNTTEDYEKEIDSWWDWLLKKSQEKKDYLSIPVVDGEPELVPIEEPMPEVKQWDAKRREIEDIKVEENQGKNLPF
jgi:hypothetical protein